MFQSRSTTTLLAKAGSLEVRLARTTDEICAAQRLRHQLFCERSITKLDAANREERDIDCYDPYCEHLLAIDRAVDGTWPHVVGTYRLLRQKSAERYCGFYTSNGFDISSLLKIDDNCLELGRSCVHPGYRKRFVIDLLWRGIWNYLKQNQIELMLGCASLDSHEPGSIARQLSFLYHFAHAPEYLGVRALPSRYVAMDRLPKNQVDQAAAFRELPPLIKGYVRLGAWFGDGAILDNQFQTLDVLTILPSRNISARYSNRFERLS